MIIKLKNNFSFILILVALVALLQGCAGWGRTTPNISIISGVQTDPLNNEELLPVQALLLNFYNLNPQMATELGKLPEFQQEKVSRDSLNALKKFILMYKGASKEEIDNLKIVVDEGYVKVRKFSAPLQAIIWLLQNDKVSAKKTKLFSFGVHEITLLAWDFRDHHWVGKGLEEVTDRLSSPKLVGCYVRRNFTYESKLVNQSTAQDYYSIFRHKKGNCQGYADFQNMCLRKAGYRAGIIKVEGMYGSPYHVAVEFEDKNGVTYVIDNSFIMFVNPFGITIKEQYVGMLPQIGKGKN